MLLSPDGRNLSLWSFEKPVCRIVLPRSLQTLYFYTNRTRETHIPGVFTEFFGVKSSPTHQHHPPASILKSERKGNGSERKEMFKVRASGIRGYAFGLESYLILLWGGRTQATPHYAALGSSRHSRNVGRAAPKLQSSGHALINCVFPLATRSEWYNKDACTTLASDMKLTESLPGSVWLRSERKFFSALVKLPSSCVFSMNNLTQMTSFGELCTEIFIPDSFPAPLPKQAQTDVSFHPARSVYRNC